MFLLIALLMYRISTPSTDLISPFLVHTWPGKTGFSMPINIFARDDQSFSCLQKTVQLFSAYDAARMPIVGWFDFIYRLYLHTSRGEIYRDDVAGKTETPLALNWGWTQARERRAECSNIMERTWGTDLRITNNRRAEYWRVDLNSVFVSSRDGCCSSSKPENI